jgi:hypothetical protein
MLTSKQRHNRKDVKIYVYLRIAVLCVIPRELNTPRTIRNGKLQDVLLLHVHVLFVVY